MNLLQISKLASALLAAQASGQTDLADLVQAGLEAVGVTDLRIAIIPHTHTIHCTMRYNGGPLHKDVSFSEIEAAFNGPERESSV